MTYFDKTIYGNEVITSDFLMAETPMMETIKDIKNCPKYNLREVYEGDGGWNTDTAIYEKDGAFFIIQFGNNFGEYELVYTRHFHSIAEAELEILT